MRNKSYAVVALEDILIRALAAVALDAVGIESAGWDLEFSQMSRKEQAAWLIQLFETLIEHG